MPRGSHFKLERLNKNEKMLNEFIVTHTFLAALNPGGIINEGGHEASRKNALGQHESPFGVDTDAEDLRWDTVEGGWGGGGWLQGVEEEMLFEAWQLIVDWLVESCSQL